MSEMAKAARAAMKAKAKKLTGGDPHEKVDASSWTPPEMMNTGAKTGMRPLTKRAYKKGGKVVGYCEGGEAPKRADRKQRKSGGRTMISDLINRNAKKANQYRDGGDAHVGGLKRGGRAHKLYGGSFTKRGEAGTPLPYGGMKKGGAAHEDIAADKKLIKKAFRQHDEHMHEGKHEEIKLKKGGKAEKWIAGAIKHPGALHKSLHVKEGEKIPAKKLAKAAHSDNPKLAKRARLAQTLKRMHKQVGGESKNSPYYFDDNKNAPRVPMYEMPPPSSSRSVKPAPGDAPTRGYEPGSYSTGPRYDRIEDLPEYKAAVEASGRKHGGKAKYNYLGGTRPTGGRIAKKDGGRTKGKTNIIISINPQQGGRGMMQPSGMPPMGPTPRPGGAAPVAPPTAPMPMLPGMGNLPPGAMPPGGVMPGAGMMPPGLMPRKSGGRVYRSYEDMDAGAGSGLGRLEKTQIQSRK